MVENAEMMRLMQMRFQGVYRAFLNRHGFTTAQAGEVMMILMAEAIERLATGQRTSLYNAL
jgi:hypothetical protein